MIMTCVAATYFDPKSGWQLNGSAIYVFNFENEATDYTSGEILNLEGNVTKNFGRWGVGVSAYAMIEITGDSGAGARLGDFESSVNGIGPILTYTLGRSAQPADVHRQVLSRVRCQEYVRRPILRHRRHRHRLIAKSAKGQKRT